MNSSKPWAILWHVKYASNWDKQDLIRLYENLKVSHIWNSAQANQDIIQHNNFWEIPNGESTIFSLTRGINKPP